jgi:6-phosphogluconate dehydrogenase
MVHNGIEYGMMQAIAEGFDILREYGKKAHQGEPLQNLEKVAKVYNHGSVIESRLIGWMGDGFGKYGENLEKVSGRAGASGEGEWTVKVAKELQVPARVIEAALEARKRSQEKPNYQGRVISVLRNMFGQHIVNNRI